MNNDVLMFEINEFLLKEYDCVFTVEALEKVLEIINKHKEIELDSELKEQDIKTRFECASAINDARMKWPTLSGVDLIGVDEAIKICAGVVNAST